jgi:cyclopropane-fatty-acyl-phospholipid synthase
MNLASLPITAAEHLDIPDSLLRAAIAARCAETGRTLMRTPHLNADFAAWMQANPVAMHTDAANAQHYELPPAFFTATLGSRRKYSSCLYATGAESLDDAEFAALQATCAMADLQDGQRILELGCGWGSLSLHMARTYPAAQIMAVSNSHAQRDYIMGQATAEGLHNLCVFTEDMNDFAPGTTFQRIVSVEMFEHMANWRALLTRVRGWLEPQGRLFLHVFSHISAPYRFDHAPGGDWIAQYFFTGGIMPSHTLIREFTDLFEVEQEDRWSGTHYQHTALHWLRNFDANQHTIWPLLQETYGAEANLWRRRWRLFFLAVAGLFGHARGQVWGVSQYRLRAA